MIYTFEYSGSTKHLSTDELNAFVKELNDTMPRNKYGSCDGLEVNRNEFYCWGWYDNEEFDIASDISWVFDHYDIDYDGGAAEDDTEPDYDKMTGGVDDY